MIGLVPVVWLTATHAQAPAEYESKVEAIFEEACEMCHSDGDDPSDPAGLDVTTLSALVGRKSAANGKPMVVAGKPGESYLLDKLYGSAGIEGDIMPMGLDPLTPEQLADVEGWIRSLAPDAATDPPDGAIRRPPPKRKPAKPFHGTTQVVLPTTTTLGQRTLQYRLDHRFGRIGTERGAFGLDAGVVMSGGIAYGIFDGWDVGLRRTNSRKAWELWTKYIGLRQEEEWPLSLGAYASFDLLRDFDVNNRYTGNLIVMLSRLWFERWSTMITLGYHMRTNKNPRPTVEVDGRPVPVKDIRDSLVLGLASSVWLDKKKRWGLDLEYFFPIPDDANPNIFYYRGGDADASAPKIGAWSIGGSYFTGLHFFQVMLTNNRELHPNLAAPGGQTDNPFNTDGVDSKNPFHKFNFFLGFNLGRRFKL